jgi:hypothetical protein
MSTISTQLRNFKEPTKDQLTQVFFSIPSLGSFNEVTKSPEEPERIEINAVLSLGVQGEEDSYVSVKYQIVLALLRCIATCREESCT